MSFLNEQETVTLRQTNQFHPQMEEQLGTTIPELFQGQIPPEKDSQLMPVVTPPVPPPPPTVPTYRRPPLGPSPGQIQGTP